MESCAWRAPDSRGPRQRESIWRDPIFWLLGVATLVLHLELRMRGPSPSIYWYYLDEGYRLYPSLRLLQGESLFADMFTAYPPLSYFLHLFAYQIFGAKVSSVRLVLVFSQVVATLSTYAISRHLVSRGFSLFAAVLTVLYGVVRMNVGYSGWYVVPLTLLTLLFLFRYIESESSKRSYLVLAGVFAGLAVATKLRDGAFVVIASLVAILAMRILLDFRSGRGRGFLFHPLYTSYLLLPVVIAGTLWADLDWPRGLLLLAPSVALCGLLFLRQTLLCGEYRPRIGRLCGEVALFLGGTAAVTLPWVLYYGGSVGWGSLWYHLIEVPLWMGSKLWRVWAPGGLDFTAAFAAAGVWTALGLAIVLDVWKRFLPGLVAAALVLTPLLIHWWPEVKPAGMYLLLPGASVLALVLVWRRWGRANVSAQHFVVLSVFCCVVPISLYPWTDSTHWMWVSAPSLIVAGVAASRVHRYLANRSGALRWVAVAAQCVVIVQLAPAVLDPRGQAVLLELREAERGDVPYDAGAARRIQKVVDFVNENVPPDAFILEIPSSFYSFITGRRQAAQLDYFFALDSTIWDEDREIASIRRNDPEYALVRKGDPKWQDGFPKVSRFVWENFVHHRRFGDVTILKKRESGAR